MCMYIVYSTVYVQKLALVMISKRITRKITTRKIFLDRINKRNRIGMAMIAICCFASIRCHFKSIMIQYNGNSSMLTASSKNTTSTITEESLTLLPWCRSCYVNIMRWLPHNHIAHPSAYYPRTPTMRFKNGKNTYCLIRHIPIERHLFPRSVVIIGMF